MAKTAIFIDGSNVYKTSKALGFDVDYKQLLVTYGDGLVRASYYTAVDSHRVNRDTGEIDNPLIPLIDWLSYNGYTVVQKPTKEFTDAAGQRKVKGNMDIEMAVDCMELAPYVDHVILFTGDGDFCSVIDALHRRGVRVSVVSSIVTSPPMVADELRRKADVFIELSDVLKQQSQRRRYA